MTAYEARQLVSNEQNRLSPIVDECLKTQVFPKIAERAAWGNCTATVKVVHEVNSSLFYSEIRDQLNKLGYTANYQNSLFIINW